jgi:ribosome recycling factor
MSEEDRLEVLKNALVAQEEALGLKNEELQKIFKLEEGEIHEEDARDLGADVDDLIKNSIKGLDLEKFLRDDEESESGTTTNVVEDTNDS